MPPDISTVPAFCPYPGLRSFNEDESLYFKGRDFHVDRIASLLEENRFLMLTGASGDGKSSLVYAGLIPRAKAGFMRTKFSHWVIADFRPERSPLLNLSTSLARQLNIESVDTVVNTLRPGYSSLIDLYKSTPFYIDKNSITFQQADELMRKKMLSRAANLLIIVDQFEEFFTNPENFYKGAITEDGKIIVNLINETNRIALQEDIPVYIICTMRSDYIGNCAAFRGLPELIGRSHYFIPRLNRDEIIQAIKEPAELSGNEISERLVERLVNDIREGMDVLPVLQHALKQIWGIATQDKQKVLDLIHYAKAGGLPRTELPSENFSDFDAWYNLLPDFQKKLYQNPCLTNVLNAHANEIYDKILEACRNNNKEIPSEPAIVERIIRTAFTCLTRMDGNKAVRDRMSVKEVTNIIGFPEIDARMTAATLNAFREPGSTLIRPFVPYYATAAADDFFSRAYDENTVLDITHEALIRNWERLKSWVSFEQESIQIFHDLCIQLKHWLDNKRSRQYLLSAGQFYYFKSWYDKHNPTTSWMMRYMSETNTHEKEKTDEQPGDENKLKDLKYQNAEILSRNIREFIASTKKAIDRTKTVAKVAVAVITLLGILSFIGFIISNKQKNLALLSEQKSKSNEVAYLSMMKNAEDPTYAFRVAEEAYKIFPGDIAKGALMAAYMNPTFYQLYKVQQGIIKSVCFSLNGKNILTTSQDPIANIINLQGNIVHSLVGHSSEIRHGEYSKDGKNILTWSDDMTAILWDTAGNKMATYSHEQYLTNAMFNPSGDRVLTTCDDKSARLWDLKGNLVKTYSGHFARVVNGAFSHDGKWVITSSEDGTAKVWDMEGKMINNIECKSPVIWAEIISNQLGFITLSQDSMLSLWDQNSRKVESIIIPRSTGNIFISPDQNHLLIPLTNYSIEHYMIKYKKNLPHLIFSGFLTGHSSPILSINFSKDSKQFVSASDDLTCRLWSFTDSTNYLMRSNEIGYSADFNPENNLIVTAHNAGTIRLWDVKNIETLSLIGHKAEVFHGRFSPDGNKILTASWDKSAGLWNIKGQLIKWLKEHLDAVHYSEFSPNGKYILTSSIDNTATLWDINGNIIQRLGAMHYGPIYNGVFSYNSNYILLPSKDNKASLWRTELGIGQSGRFLFFLKGHSARVRRAIFSKDDQLIITGSNDKTAKIWNLQGELISTLKFHKGEIYDLAISPDNKFIGLASTDGSGSIWNIDGKFLFPLKGHLDMLTCIMFSHNDNFIATTSADKTAKIWDISGKLITTLIGHTQFVNSIAFSNDDKTVLTSSDDGTARLWDLNGNCLNVYRGHTGGVQCAIFSPDNKTILTTSKDGTARLWPLTIEDVLNKINIEKTRGRVWNLPDEDKKQLGISQ